MIRDIHNIIQREYERRQKQSADVIQQRKSELYDRLPDLLELDSQISKLGIKYNKLMLTDGANKPILLEEMNNSINLLRAQKQNILKEHHIDPEYLSAPHQCQLCSDTGFLTDEFGSKRCSCYKQQVISLLFEQSNINLNGNESFENFDESLYPDEIDSAKYGISISPRENIRNVKDICLDFIDNFDNPEQKNLFFSGRTGVGKTFLSFCIARELMENGRTVLYLSAPQLFDIVTNYKMRQSRDDSFNDDKYQSIFNVELLIIDDLGTESLSDARYAELLNILNTRYAKNGTSACKTIISTNLGAKKLFELYTERVASRIVGHFERLVLAGIDIRSHKA